MVFAIINQSFCQSIYYDILPSEKTPFFFDDFSSNRNNWSNIGQPYNEEKPKPDGWKCHRCSCKTCIKDNTLIIDNPANPYVLQTLSIDQSKDFEIEILIDEANEESGLVWWENANKHILVNTHWTNYGYGQNHTHLSITEKTPDYSKTLIKEKITRSKKEDDGVLLTIRKVANTYYFFLDQKLAYLSGFQPSVNNKIGFYGSWLVVKQISFYYLPMIPQPNYDKTRKYLKKKLNAYVRAMKLDEELVLKGDILITTATKANVRLNSKNGRMWFYGYEINRLKNELRAEIMSNDIEKYILDENKRTLTILGIMIYVCRNSDGDYEGYKTNFNKLTIYFNEDATTEDMKKTEQALKHFIKIHSANEEGDPFGKP